MSCQINSIGNISDVEEIKKFLFLPDADTDLGNESWLQKCLLSISPVGDLIALAKGRKLVILASKWNSATASSIFQITFSGTVHEVDNIKSVLCLPIVGQSKSSNILPDWTCVLLGFESGYVRVYLETFELIFEEQFHNEDITSIKCRSQHSPRSDILFLLHPEEIYVQYQTNICIIQGKPFFQALRNNRAQLARVQANSELLDYQQQPLDIKKWEFQDQSMIKDFAVVGLSISNTFDNLLAASTCGGYDAKFRTVPPNHTLVLAVGWKPFLGFHFATEGSNQAILSDVAKIVAHKLKSALPSWLTGNAQLEKRPSTVQQPTDPMGCRFGLCDLNRAANTIILSSDHKLAAISDSLGRVIIIDTEKGIALKILKGYREAQCAFIQVPDNRHSSSAKIETKIALFLVIYSPKKGTLEIFNTQQFMKITTFSASKNSRLVYINHSLMGFTSPTKSKYACQFTTLLVDPDGQMKEILIPFHFALNEKSSKKAKDIHLYKKLRQMIRCEDYSTDSLMSAMLDTVKELQTVEMKLQLVELLLKTKHLPVEILLQCAIYIADNIGEEANTELEKTFKIKVNNIVSILNFYVFMKSNNDDDDLDSKLSEDDTVTILTLGEKEMNQMKPFLYLMGSLDDEKHSKELKVRFAEHDASSITEFLSIFNLTADTKIGLMPKHDETVIHKFCEDLFSNFDIKCKNLKKFKHEVEKSNINTKDLFLLLIMYWVNRPLEDFPNLENEINNLTNILYILIKRAIEISSIENSLKYYWEDIREVIFNSSKPFPALTAAISCKYVAYKIEKEQESENASIAIDDEDFEIWSKENVEWTLLIGKLEDVSLLNILVVKKPVVSKYSTLPKLTTNDKKLDISLNFVLQQKGSVSELVARWLTMSGIDPELIVLNGTLNELSKTSKNEDLEQKFPKEKIEFLKTEKLFTNFNMIKFHWPYSLDTGMILANMCWEYALQWQHDLHNLEHLEACISCLKAIPNFFLKLGLFNLVWKTHLRFMFENTIKLINTVGKVPKKRLCLQDTNLSDVEIPIFLKITTDYLDTFTDIAQDMYVEPQTPIKFETLWENGGQPLAELAVQQTSINYELLLTHYELSLVFHMLCQFSIKAFKPMQNLFDVEVIKVFFMDFQDKPEVDYGRTDSTISTARIQFLKKIIASGAETITSKDGKEYFKDHNYWMSKCLLLGKIWKLNRDILRMEEVKQLFIQGYDVAGHYKKGTVEDKHSLGLELLLIAGKRMDKYMAKSSNLGTIHTYLTPLLTEWIEKLNKDWCAESSLKDIYNLAREAVICIDKERHEHTLARVLCEALEQLGAQLDTDDSDSSLQESLR